MSQSWCLGHCGVPPAEGSVGNLVWEEVQGVVQEGAWAFRTSPRRGSAPGAFGQSPLSEENSQQEFSPI